MIDDALHVKLKTACDLLFECHEELMRNGRTEDSRLLRAAFSATTPVRDRVGQLVADAKVKGT